MIDTAVGCRSSGGCHERLGAFRTGADACSAAALRLPGARPGQALRAHGGISLPRWRRRPWRSLVGLASLKAEGMLLRPVLPGRSLLAGLQGAARHGAVPGGLPLRRRERRRRAATTPSSTCCSSPAPWR
ncbi:MAG: hypothetical protein MZV70_71555 [Desulfobacterales bacterium]|nr:hypothetical protein [Desulfobacterales bacterium]